jgi:hypothetical protein
MYTSISIGRYLASIKDLEVNSPKFNACLMTTSCCTDDVIEERSFDTFNEAKAWVKQRLIDELKQDIGTANNWNPAEDDAT